MTIQEKAQIVAETAIDFLCAKHNANIHDVVDALNAGHPKLREQFAELVSAGIMEAA